MLGTLSDAVLASFSAAVLGLLSAQEPANVEASAEVDATPATAWIRRYPPRRNMFHLGVFGGVLFPARDVELFELDSTDAEQGFRAYRRVAPEFGGRIAFFPLDFLGLEVEGAFALGEVEGDERANLWALRGHVIGQVPRWSVTPFVLAGAGALGVRSGAAAVGNDTDLAFHLGGGVMVHVTDAVTLRLGLRNTISPQQGEIGGATNSPEILLGVGWTRRPPRPPEPAPRPLPAPLAAVPEAPTDGDGDGFIDDEDVCPQDAGIAPDGCPDPDPDGDGVLGEEDMCPEQTGVAPDGCPSRDQDGDGLDDDVDKCPAEPETRNKFQDDDGCPDVLPEDLGSFEGTLDGVNFQIDSASLRPSSKRKLDEVVAILQKYGQTRVQISGHTDSSGPTEHNLALSKERADAVKSYLVENGVAEGRVETRGAGPDEPIDTNATTEGRANNRRIEFRLLN